MLLFYYCYCLLEAEGVRVVLADCARPLGSYGERVNQCLTLAVDFLAALGRERHAALAEQLFLE